MWGEREVHSIKQASQEIHTENVKTLKRSEGNEGINQADVWRKRVLSRGNC